MSVETNFTLDEFTVVELEERRELVSCCGIDFFCLSTNDNNCYCEPGLNAACLPAVDTACVPDSYCGTNAPCGNNDYCDTP